MSKPMHVIHSDPVNIPRRIKILMYHRVIEADNYVKGENLVCVPRCVFRRHLDLLDRWGYTTITFNDYRMALDGDITLPRRPVIITFDDGYLDTYSVAFPLLLEFGMKAVVFVLGDSHIHNSIWDNGVIQTLAPLMTTEQLLEMHAAGFEIGSHSLSHTKLTEIDQQQAWEEISRSRVLLELLLNAPVRTFSYPYGLVNRDIKRMVAEAGYAHGCGVYSGPPGFCTDKYEIRRIPMFGNTDRFRFALRMLAPYEYYAWSRRQAGIMVRAMTVFGNENHTAVDRV